MKPFGRTRKHIAIVIVAIGLSTFFVPLFSASPSFAGRTHWSAWNLASQVCASRPPVADIVFNNVLLGIVLTYPLMLCALVAVLAGSQKAVVAIAVIGSISGYEPFYWGHVNFARIFLRSAGIQWHSIRYEPGIVVLAAVMPALLYVSLSKTLDASKSWESWRPREEGARSPR